MAHITARTPVWRLRGGWGIIVYALIALISLVMDQILDLQSNGSALFWVVIFLPVVSGVVLLLATIWLAFGGPADDGIVGPSKIGTIALVAFGVLVLASDIVYLDSYFLNDQTYPTINIILLVLQILGFVTAAAAAVYIFIENVAHSLARWSLFLAIALGIVNALVTAPDWAAVLTSALAILAQLYVGVTYLFNGAPAVDDIV